MRNTYIILKNKAAMEYAVYDIKPNSWDIEYMPFRDTRTVQNSERGHISFSTAYTRITATEYIKKHGIPACIQRLYN